MIKCIIKNITGIKAEEVNIEANYKEINDDIDVINDILNLTKCYELSENDVNNAKSRINSIKDNLTKNKIRNIINTTDMYKSGFYTGAFLSFILIMLMKIIEVYFI